MNGCQHCNPYCDACKPAAIKYFACDSCRFTNAYSKKAILSGEELKCAKCGAPMDNLARPAVVLCRYVGELCAYPCGRSETDPTGGTKGFCSLRTCP